RRRAVSHPYDAVHILWIARGKRRQDPGHLKCRTNCGLSWPIRKKKPGQVGRAFACKRYVASGPRPGGPAARTLRRGLDLGLVEGRGPGLLEGGARRHDPDFRCARAGRAGANLDAAGVNSLLLDQVRLGVDRTLLRYRLTVALGLFVVADDYRAGIGLALQAKRNIVQDGLGFVVHARRTLGVLELNLVQLGRLRRWRWHFDIHTGGGAGAQAAIIRYGRGNRDRAGRRPGGVQRRLVVLRGETPPAGSPVVGERAIVRALAGAVDGDCLAGAHRALAGAAGDGWRMRRRLFDYEAGAASGSVVLLELGVRNRRRDVVAARRKARSVHGRDIVFGLDLAAGGAEIIGDGVVLSNISSGDGNRHRLTRHHFAGLGAATRGQWRRRRSGGELEYQPGAKLRARKVSADERTEIVMRPDVVGLQHPPRNAAVDGNIEAASGAQPDAVVIAKPRHSHPVQTDHPVKKWFKLFPPPDKARTDHYGADVRLISKVAGAVKREPKVLVDVQRGSDAESLRNTLESYTPNVVSGICPGITAENVDLRKVLILSDGYGAEKRKKHYSNEGTANKAQTWRHAVSSGRTFRTHCPGSINSTSTIKIQPKIANDCNPSFSAGK